MARLDVFSAPFRYVWPSELDLMARLAGMTFVSAGRLVAPAVHRREPLPRLGVAAPALLIRRPTGQVASSLVDMAQDQLADLGEDEVAEHGEEADAATGRR